MILISSVCNAINCGSGDRGQSGDPYSLDSGGVQITSAFTPGSQIIDTVQLIPTTHNEFGQNIGLHSLAVSRSAKWLVYLLGDPADTLDSFAIRPFNTSAITDEVTGMDPATASVVGDIAVQVLASDVGVDQMEEYDFAEHAEETFVFSTDGQLYCVDFSNVKDAAPGVVLGAADVDIVPLTAGILPTGVTAGDATWRPDGTGVVFGAVLNTGSTNSEQVIAEIVFGAPYLTGGCPGAPTAYDGSTYNVIAGGGSRRRDPKLLHPDYRPNAL